MVSAFAVHLKGLGLLLRSAIQAWMAASRSATLLKTPRRMRWRVRRNDLRVDVFEQRVAVGMVRAVVRLAVHLAREAQQSRSRSMLRSKHPKPRQAKALLRAGSLSWHSLTPATGRSCTLVSLTTRYMVQMSQVSDNEDKHTLSSTRRIAEAVVRQTLRPTACSSTACARRRVPCRAMSPEGA